MAGKKNFVLRLAGVLAPLLFVVVFTAFGFSRQGYSALSTYVSALSLEPSGWVQVANFMVFGVLCGLFAISLFSLFRGSGAPGAGPILLSLSALCFFLSGPFVMDPMGTAQADATAHGTVHGILGAVAFVLMPISCFVFHGRLRKDRGWPVFQRWTLAAGIVTSCTVVFFSVVSKSPSLSASFSGWLGLLQRSVIVPYMAWLFAFGLAAYGRAPGISGALRPKA